MHRYKKRTDGGVPLERLHKDSEEALRQIDRILDAHGIAVGEKFVVRDYNAPGWSKDNECVRSPWSSNEPLADYNLGNWELLGAMKRPGAIRKVSRRRR